MQQALLYHRFTISAVPQMLTMHVIGIALMRLSWKPCQQPTVVPRSSEWKASFVMSVA